MGGGCDDVGGGASGAREEGKLQLLGGPLLGGGVADGIGRLNVDGRGSGRAVGRGTDEVDVDHKNESSSHHWLIVDGGHFECSERSRHDARRGQSKISWWA